MPADERHHPLYSIDAKIPKLDVAGSNPVSRSIESIGYRQAAGATIRPRSASLAPGGAPTPSGTIFNPSLATFP
jgi:hypothetical protein